MPKRAATELLLDKTYPRIWHRGEGYADQGKVNIVKTEDKEVEAKVQGTEEYNVKLKIITNGIRRDCDCPYPKSICKHIVAVAILWDEKRGFERPTPDQVDSLTRGLAKNNRRQLNAIFREPLEADPDIIRKVPIWKGFPSPRKETHAELPDGPSISEDEKQPLRKEEVTQALAEMEKWTERSSYDFYFCSGEMAAGFCELLQVIEERLPASAPEQVIIAMAQCVNWFYREFIQIMDGSDGVWIFPQVRIGKIVAKLLKKYPRNSAWKKFRLAVKEAGSGWGEPQLDENKIAEWKKKRL